MNEFIEKLNKSLNHLLNNFGEHCEEWGSDKEGDCHRKSCSDCVLTHAIEIVNQLAEEYKDNVIIDGQYCWQTCGAAEHCKDCNRLCNGSIDYYENYDFMAEEYNNGWIPCSERLPECENKYGWVSCIVSVIRSHYPTSPYDICDSPYDENIVMHANYNVSQKIWHLECDEQLNALIDIEDAPLNGDYVIAWQPLPAPYTEGD